jgi:hypothetical protein
MYQKFGDTLGVYPREFGDTLEYILEIYWGHIMFYNVSPSGDILPFC